MLLPLARADARNQLSQAVIRLTNPLVLPLRKLLPPIGKVDTASIVAFCWCRLRQPASLWSLGVSLGRHAGRILPCGAGQPARHDPAVLHLALLLYVLLSWVAPGTYSPASALFHSLCEPLLPPVRRVIPPLGGIDFSALFVIIGLWALYIAIS